MGVVRQLDLSRLRLLYDLRGVPLVSGGVGRFGWFSNDALALQQTNQPFKTLFDIANSIIQSINSLVGVSVQANEKYSQR